MLREGTKALRPGCVGPPVPLRTRRSLGVACGPQRAFGWLRGRLLLCGLTPRRTREPGRGVAPAPNGQGRASEGRGLPRGARRQERARNDAICCASSEGTGLRRGWRGRNSGDGRKGLRTRSRSSGLTAHCRVQIPSSRVRSSILRVDGGANDAGAGRWPSSGTSNPFLRTSAGVRRRKTELRDPFNFLRMEPCCEGARAGIEGKTHFTWSAPRRCAGNSPPVVAPRSTSSS